MIVIDDYKEGIVYAGRTMADLTSHFIPDELMEKVKSFVDTNGLPSKPKHFMEDGLDFYLSVIDDNKLLKYMSDRNCDNFIYGV